MEEVLKSIETSLRALELWGRIGAKNVLNLHECAMYIGTSDGRVYNLVNEGAIPCSKSRGKLYFSKNEIDLWLTAENKRTAADIKSEAALILTKLKTNNNGRD